MDVCMYLLRTRQLTAAIKDVHKHTFDPELQVMIDRKLRVQQLDLRPTL